MTVVTYPDTPLKQIVRTLLPHRVYCAVKRVVLSRRARELRDRCARRSTVSDLVHEVLQSPYFRPDQKQAEIAMLLELLQRRSIHRMCEIGGRIGGSLALFAQVAAPDAQMLSIDIEYKCGQKEALSRFANDGQRITCVAADSHAPETLRLVTDWLGGRQLDFLFIDGDHSLDGVTSDFNTYASLVGENGIIAFHDIVPDSRTRRGVVTGADVGQVPVFWTSLKERGLRTEEYVESWDQDGFGIGVLYWEGR